jgi:hypothetical protein
MADPAVSPLANPYAKLISAHPAVDSPVLTIQKPPTKRLVFPDNSERASKINFDIFVYESMHDLAALRGASRKHRTCRLTESNPAQPRRPCGMNELSRVTGDWESAFSLAIRGGTRRPPDDAC